MRMNQVNNDKIGQDKAKKDGAKKDGAEKDRAKRTRAGEDKARENRAKKHNKPHKLGTFGSDETLPKPPLPTLADSKKRFMEWCSPLLDDEERLETQQLLDDFAMENGLGELLQDELETSAKGDDEQNRDEQSWLDDYWRNLYLGQRRPIALNDNYFFLFQHVQMTRLQRAAALVAAALNYKLVLDQELIPAIKDGDRTLDMSQLKNLFSSTRIPGDPQDSSRRFYTDRQPGPSTARHIMAFYRNNIYRLDIIGENGAPCTLQNIHDGLDAIMDDGLDIQPEGRSPGHLTTLPRARWARVRKELAQTSKKNKNDLDLIETALFTISLEDEEPLENLAACDQLLHGNSGNRWFDKSLQLIVFKNGVAGVNVERSKLDGCAVLNFIDYVLGVDPQSMDHYSGAMDQGVPAFRRLVFDLPPSLQKEISNAADGFETQKRAFTASTFDFTDFGAAHIKKLNMSPDAFAQLAMQLAHYRVRGFVGSVSEAVSARHFRKGRTQTMRAVTPASKIFLETMLDNGKGDATRIKAFRAAADQHVERTKQCRDGEAPEQHLLELLNTQNRQPEKFVTGFIERMMSGGGLSSRDVEQSLAFFDSPGWTKLRAASLSTGAAPSPSIIYYGFGAPNKGAEGERTEGNGAKGSGAEAFGGFGGTSVGYLLRDEQINCYLGAAKAEEQTLTDFIEFWRTAMRELAALLEKDPALNAKAEQKGGDDKEGDAKNGKEAKA